TVKMQHRSRAHASRSDALTPGATTYSRPRIRRGAPAAAVALGLSLACPPALAAPLPPPPDPRAEEDVQPLLTRAIALFDDRQFDEAIPLFEEAYAIDPEANYLFNIGRVYEEKGDLETALVYYTRFVEHPEAAPEAKAMTEKRIVRLQSE